MLRRVIDRESGDATETRAALGANDRLTPVPSTATRNSPTADCRKVPTAPGAAERLILGCFAFSGFAALSYEAAWARLFSIAFGSSEVAAAAVLAAYIGGLAGGAAVAGRYADRIQRPLRAYTLIEGGVAITALLVPAALQEASILHGQLLGISQGLPASGGLEQTVFYFGATFLIVGLPAALMGATLPLVVRYFVRTDRQIASRVGLAYGLNTAGAVVGVLVTTFLLLPHFGVRSAVWAGVLVNGLICVVVLFVPENPSDDRPRTQGSGSSADTRSSGSQSRRRQAWILPIMAVSGAIAFTCEVLWIRLLSHVLGSSIYAFGTMLGSFLSGIAIGGALGGWIVRKSQSPVLWFSAFQAGIAVSAALTWIPFTDSVEGYSTFANSVGLAAMTMLPAAVFFGATYPCAVRIVSDGVEHVAGRSAQVYAWNTLGAVAGAICASLLVLPSFGFEGTLHLAIVTSVVLSLITVVALTRPTWRTTAIPIFLLVAVLVHAPTRPEAIVSKSSLDLGYRETEQELYYAVGKTATVLLSETPAGFELRTNGLPESLIPFEGATAFRNSQRWLGILPVLARPDLDSIFIVGLGGGVAVDGVPPTVSDVDVVELEKQVVTAFNLVRETAGGNGVDRRYDIVVNDARSTLLLTDKKYDAVVSQPSHPWTAGAANLYTTEYFRLVKQHLNDDGTLLVWMNATFMTPDLLQSLAASIQATFRYVRVYQVESMAINFIASDALLSIEQQVRATSRPLTDAESHYVDNGILNVVDILATLLLDESGVQDFAATASTVTDDHNRMATQTRWRGDGLYSDELVELLEPFDPLLRQDSEIRQSLNSAELIYLAKKWLDSGQRPRLEKLVSILDAGVARDAILAMTAGIDRDEQNRQDVLVQAYRQSDRSNDAAWPLISHDLDSVAIGQGSPLQSEIASRLEAGAATVLRAWRACAADDWSAIEAADNDLGWIASVDAWYPEAQELRARWRLQDSTDRQRIRDASILIEQGLAVGGGHRLYGLRAEAALLEGDEVRYVESVIHMAQALRQFVSQAAWETSTEPAGQIWHLDSVLSRHLQLLDREPGQVRSSRVVLARQMLRDLRTEVQKRFPKLANSGAPESLPDACDL